MSTINPKLTVIVWDDDISYYDDLDPDMFDKTFYKLFYDDESVLQSYCVLPQGLKDVLQERFTESIMRNNKTCAYRSHAQNVLRIRLEQQRKNYEQKALSSM